MAIKDKDAQLNEQEIAAFTALGQQCDALKAQYDQKESQYVPDNKFEDYKQEIAELNQEWQQIIDSKLYQDLNSWLVQFEGPAAHGRNNLPDHDPRTSPMESFIALNTSRKKVEKRLRMLCEQQERGQEQQERGQEQESQGRSAKSDIIKRFLRRFKKRKGSEQNRGKVNFENRIKAILSKMNIKNAIQNIAGKYKARPKSHQQQQMIRKNSRSGIYR